MLFRSLFSPPGGKVAFDESPKECAKRELLEETGIIALDALIPIGLVTETGYQRPLDQWVMVLYKLTLPEPIAAPPASPEGEFQWVSTDAILQLPIPDTDRTALWNRVLKNDYFEIHIRCENGRIISVV